MYLKYWGLTEKPFQNTPDPRFFYNSVEHEEALTRITYTIEENLGAGMLTGTFGCGKTVIGHTLSDKIASDRYKLSFITHPQLEYIELLRAIVRNLKAVELPTKKTELSSDSLLEILGKILENNERDGKETIIIIDEAHVVEDERIFEGLRLLLNFQKRDKFLLTLLLFGQPELKQKVEDNKQLDQRIAVKCHLDAFNFDDTRRYILHRLSIVGGTESIFDADAFLDIHNRSGGIPRRINRICDISLFVGMCQGVKSIDEKMVQQGLESIQG